MWKGIRTRIASLVVFKDKKSWASYFKYNFKKIRITIQKYTKHSSTIMENLSQNVQIFDKYANSSKIQDNE